MNEYVRSKFLCDYEFLAVTLPDLPNPGKLFFRMAEMYRLKDAEKLFELCSSGEVLAISTKNDYCTFSRMSSCVKTPQKATDAVIRARGAALVYATDNGLIKQSAKTPLERCEILSAKAEAGDVNALYALGVAECEGLGVPQNRAQGVENLRRAAYWNHASSALYLLTADETNMKEYADILFSCTVESYAGSIADLISSYGVKPDKDEICGLLSGLISMGKDVGRDVIIPQVQNVLRSRILSCPDKRYILFRFDRDLINTVANFPRVSPPMAKTKVTAEAPLSREADAIKIERYVMGMRNCANEKYRPLMICSDESYVRDTYLNSLSSALSGCNVLVVDAGKVDEEHFELTHRNVVIGGLDQKRPNVVVFKLYGRVSPRKTEFVKKFLDTASRGALDLSIGVRLNLSNVVPVVVADAGCAEELRQFCNVLSASPTTKEERMRFLDTYVSSASALYGLDGVTVEEGAKELLADLDPDASARCLERLMSGAEAGSTLTVDAVKSEMKKIAPRQLGFKVA